MNEQNDAAAALIWTLFILAVLFFGCDYVDPYELY